MPYFSRVYFLLLALFLTGSAQAFDLVAANEQQGIRAQSMGGAYRAVANGNDAIHFNPAGLAFFRRFNLDADYLYHARNGLHWVGLSLADSMTSNLAAGLDVHVGVNSQKPADLSYLASFSTAYPIFEIFSIGATIKYAYFPDLLASASPPQAPDNAVNRITGDIGLMLQFPFGLSLAAVGYNLIPVASKRLPLSVGFGGAFHIGSKGSIATDPSMAYGGFTIAVDWLMRDLAAAKIEHQLSVGGEYYLLDMIPLRAGYTFSLADQSHKISAGLGLFFQIIEVDALFQQDLTHLQYRTFGGALRFFF